MRSTAKMAKSDPVAHKPAHQQPHNQRSRHGPYQSIAPDNRPGRPLANLSDRPADRPATSSATAPDNITLPPVNQLTSPAARKPTHRHHYHTARTTAHPAQTAGRQAAYTPPRPSVITNPQVSPDRRSDGRTATRTRGGLLGDTTISTRTLYERASSIASV